MEFTGSRGNEDCDVLRRNKPAVCMRLKTAARALARFERQICGTKANLIRQGYSEGIHEQAAPQALQRFNAWEPLSFAGSGECVCKTP
jgi:hypothetical protein